MPDLNSKLQSFHDDDERTEYLFDLMNALKKKVDDVLLFGPCNKNLAYQAKNTYYRKKMQQGKFYNVEYREEELSVLPAIISNILYLNANLPSLTSVTATEIYESYFKDSYQYGTGTCEFFSIVGAYFLATEFDLDLSIETIHSNESHTYIKLHTNPEFVIDFWSPMVCKYGDTLSWNEFFGEIYLRNEHSTFKTNLVLTSSQLIAMGDRVFSKENGRRRLQIMDKVREIVTLEASKPQSDENTLNSRGRLRVDY